MWEFFDILISGIDSNIEVADFVIGPRWAAVLSEEGSVGLAPIWVERFDRFDFSYKPEIGMKLSDMANGIYKWNYFEASLALAAINSFYNAPNRVSQKGKHAPGGRRSKGFFKQFCSEKKVAGKTLFVEPHYDSDEMADVDGRFDVIRKNPEFREYIYPAYRELTIEVERVILSGTTIVDKTIGNILNFANELEKKVILLGPDIPLSESVSEVGISASGGFVVDNIESFMLRAKSGMVRDDFLTLGHFVSLQF